jgi:flagellar biosynthetic protein FliQ
MGVSEVMTILQGAMMTSFALAGPILGAALIAGVLVSIFQAATQIHEMTLTFVPKIGAVVLVLLLLLPWMLERVMAFTTFLFTYAGRLGAAS